MQSILQSLLPRLTTDKFSNNLYFHFTSSLKAAGVVENVTVAVCDDDFVVDVMQATLLAGCSRSAVTNNNEPAQPPLWGRVLPASIMSLNVPLGMRTHLLALSP